MVKITFFQNPAGDFVGFTCSGHADYAESQDIVCAGASALVLNCINSIETLTSDTFFCDRESDSGTVIFRLAEGFSDRSQLLLRSLALGLEGIEEEYEEHIDLLFEEVEKT